MEQSSVTIFRGLGLMKDKVLKLEHLQLMRLNYLLKSVYFLRSVEKLKELRIKYETNYSESTISRTKAFLWYLHYSF